MHGVGGVIYKIYYKGVLAQDSSFLKFCSSLIISDIQFVLYEVNFKFALFHCFNKVTKKNEKSRQISISSFYCITSKTNLKLSAGFHTFCLVSR